MSWCGWTWDRRRWVLACRAGSIPACCRMLEELRPGLPSTHYAVTGGHVPGWTPGKLSWEA